MNPGDIHPHDCPEFNYEHHPDRATEIPRRVARIVRDLKRGTLDSLAAAKKRQDDPVIVDTAGRLHTKYNLMSELQKMCRIAAREVADAPHQVLLVIDATTGQNGLQQARQFVEHAGSTGIILTKLDGTAKGGVVVAIARELALPIQFVGVGEKIDDLLPFDPKEFVESLFEA